MDESGLALPTEFASPFHLGQAQLDDYLSSVHGGHPVHSSDTLARAAGFSGIPLAGAHVVGAALAAFTQCFKQRPIQLLAIRSRFLLPVYPGNMVTVGVLLDVASVKKRPHYQIGQYAGGCFLQSGAMAIELEIELRLVLADTAG
ncbi:MAG TPA: MaoC family dehydratase [Candidimonas sp.]|nr:MaoC family dehydratase [Candidimonas sp.]